MKTTAYQLLLLLPVLFCFSFLKAQDVPTAPPREYNFVYQIWNNQSGLPQNTVYDLVRDSTGYLWGATEEGLFRFDGAEFTIINESNTDGLYSHTFYDLLPAGIDLWASSRTAVIRLRNKVEKIIDFRKFLSGGYIKCIEKDVDGNIWVGTSVGELYYINKDSVYKCRNWKSENDASIERIRATPKGMVIGTTIGLFRIENPVASPVAISFFEGMSISAISVGKPDELWVGTSNQGLFRISQADTLSFSDQNGLKENFINSLYYGNDGRLWIGLRSNGYQVLANGQFINPVQTNYDHDGIRSIFTSGNDVVWMGSTSSGLLQLKPAVIMEPPAALELQGKIILPIYQHHDGDIWVGTAGRGVHRYSNNMLTQYSMANGLSNDLVLSIYGRGDFIYLGTSNGLDRFNITSNKMDRHYTQSNGLQNNGVPCIFTDSRDRLWVTTRMGGLHRILKEDQIERLALPTSMRQATLLCAFEDRKHNVWFGSRGTGMLKVGTDDKVTAYHQPQGFPADIVYAFFEDEEGDLWIATEKGLVVYHHGKFRLFNKESGLLFNDTYRIMQDPKGFVWVSGNLGIQRLNMKALLEAKHSTLANPKLMTRLFNVQDGMPNSETNGGFFPAGWTMQDGTIWFPTVKGVAIANHQFVSEEEVLLNIHIQSLRYGNHEYFPHEEIKLPPGVHNFEIRYTSIDFFKAGDIRFFYRLKGLNDEWTSSANRHIANFSALEPGNYTFEVRAERYGHSSSIAQLSFTVLPLFYQTIWFKVLMGILALAIIGSIILYLRRASRRKVREQKRITLAQINGQEKERQFISTELHDSINQQLTTAKIYLDFAQSNQAMMPELIKKSESMIQTVISEIRNLCNSLTPRSLEDIGLKEALEDLLEVYTSVGKFNSYFNYHLPTETLEEDLQFTLFRIVQEQINNIARHADAKEVWLDAESTPTLLTITIRDNGKGFDPKTQQYGMGIENIRNRLSLYQGKIEIRSAPGKGCTVVLQIPGRF